MTYVYLDTNIYNDIERAAVPADDVRDFRAAVASGELVVRGSIVDLEESLGLWKEDRAAAQRRLHIFRELAGFDRLLNQPSDLLEGAIQAYAAGASMPSPLLPRRERLQVAASLERIAAGDAKLDRIVDEILAGVRAQKESVQAGMNAGREKVVAELNSKYRPDELRAVQFEGFFEGGALGWAEDYAAPTGVVDECRKRGLEGLLQVRAVAGRRDDDVAHPLPSLRGEAFKIQRRVRPVACDPGFRGRRVRDARRQILSSPDADPGRHRPPRRQVLAGSAGRVVSGSLPLSA